MAVTEEIAEADMAARITRRAAEIGKVDAMLAERKATHGEYRDDARAAMRLKDNLGDEINRRIVRGQAPMSDIQRHALDMILHKIARIVTGDASFKDHWDDIQGYAKLVSDRIEPKPVNGADALGMNNRVPCPCKAHRCLAEDGVEMKYAYCVRGKDAPRMTPWPGVDAA